VTGTRTGDSFSSLYEMETTFKKTVSDLGLAPLSARNESRIRNELGLVIGRGLRKMELSKTHNPKGRLQKKSIVGTLKSIAKTFNTAEPNLRGLETGFRDSHQIQVAMSIRTVLAQKLGSLNGANQVLSEFCNQMNTVAQACLIAAKNVSSTKHRAGQKAIDWYDDFTRTLIFIAGLNKIRTTVETDRDSGKPKGHFSSLAASFERLLHPNMRSRSLWALAKRLSNSLRRVKKGINRS
jgi:hypothetical protein